MNRRVALTIWVLLILAAAFSFAACGAEGAGLETPSAEATIQETDPAYPDATGIPASADDRWKLELYHIDAEGDIADIPISYVYEKTEGEIVFSTGAGTAPESSGLFNFSVSGQAGDVVISGNIQTDISITGRVEGGKLMFTPAFECISSNIVASVYGVEVETDWSSAFEGTSAHEQGSIRLSDGAQTSTQYAPEGAGTTVFTFKWRITKLGPAEPCEECPPLPDIGPDMEQLLKDTAESGETPQHTRDAVLALALETYGIGDCFEYEGACCRVAGFSLNFTYLYGDESDELLDSFGADGSQYKHCSLHREYGTVLGEGGDEISVFYDASIIIALDPA